MSLKAFHIVFILISVALCLVFGGWGYQRYMDENGVLALGFIVASLGASWGLVLYLKWFLRKSKHLGLLMACLIPIFYSTPAMACAVCIGNIDSPMTRGVKAAVWFLLGVVGLVLAGFGGIFLYWSHRSRLLSQSQPK